jgi:hypothetical protein
MHFFADTVILPTPMGSGFRSSASAERKRLKSEK